MADESTTAAADKLAILTNKLERESRFTRSLVVICTVANIGVSFYALTQTFQTLPTVLLYNFMGNLDKIFDQWHAYEATRFREMPRTESGKDAAAPAGEGK